MDELIKLTARQALAKLKAGEIAPSDLLDAAERRIAETDGAVNALPTRCFDRARQQAKQLKRPQDAPPNYLHGLPVAIKDLNDVAGVRTTQGSPIYRDRVPDTSDIMVERLEALGALVVAKSNTPEFGAGAQTFNEVFGVTTNPWNTAMTPSGSSGGAAAALAAGQVWLATGSDFGGSCRTPASFCSVVGFRPSPGRIARSTSLPFGSLAVQGPLARNVGDAALLFDAQAGFDARDPSSLPDPGESFLAAAERPAAPKRIAFSADLGGVSPVDPEVAGICRQAAQRLERLGARVDEAAPDFRDAEPIFLTLRAAQFAAQHAPKLAEHRDKLKPEVIGNIEKGLRLTADEIGRAERARAAYCARNAAFFAEYDLLLCPVAPVAPFDHRIRYLEEAGGWKFESYISWVAFTFAITLTACPALSLPAGFTKSGLPVGLQLVARPRAEAALFAAAAALEAELGIADRVPIDPRA